MGEENHEIVVREFDHKKDLLGVEDVERRCEVGPSGKLSLFTDLLGDPICRVRNSPAFNMLVNTKNAITFPFSVTPSSSLSHHLHSNFFNRDKRN